jgi:hypothetical protein
MKMDRREALKAFGSALSLPVLEHFSSAELLALGEETHARLQTGSYRERYIFKALDQHQSKTVAEISELIIPETNTPGAKAARVDEFIDLMLAEWFPAEDKIRFLNGLTELDEKSRELTGNRFTDCDTAQQVEILEAQEESAIGFRNQMSQEEVEETSSAQAIPKRHFFDFMKYLTLWGYFTSEVGIRDEIHRRRVHPTYSGCVPLES